MWWTIIAFLAGVMIGAIAMAIVASARDPVYLVKEEKDIVKKRLKEEIAY